MAIRGAQTKIFRPVGLSDSLDGTNAFEGACASLSNLIPSPRTKDHWVCRPAQTELTTFTGFSSPGFISCMKIIGDTVYGMIATATHTGKDEPFAYNIATGSFVTITGVTGSNVPNSPASSGAWTPPTMDLVGPYLIVTHPGFDGITNFFGWFDITNPATPTWNAGNTTSVALPAVPVAVANFNGRAYFAVNLPTSAATYFTDELSLNITNGVPPQILTYDDAIPITALKPITLQAQGGTGIGIASALIVFKGTSHSYQVTGDFALGTLARDAMNYAVGSLSPLAISDTPQGVSVICPDGLRIIDRFVQFSPPIGVEGSGVNFPFVSALVPSRVVSACNATVLRIAVQNASVSGQPFEDYWYHLDKKKWSGPHTFAPSLVEPYMTKFVTAPVDVPGSLWLSETVPSTTSVYAENGAQINCTYTPVYLPDQEVMAVYAFNQMTIQLAIDPNMNSWTASALDADRAQYDSVGNIIPNTAPFWDTAVWDTDVWDGIATGLSPRLIEWTQPIVSSRVQFSITFGAAAGVIIGNLKYEIQFVGYAPETGI